MRVSENLRQLYFRQNENSPEDSAKPVALSNLVHEKLIHILKGDNYKHIIHTTPLIKHLRDLNTKGLSASHA